MAEGGSPALIGSTGAREGSPSVGASAVGECCLRVAQRLQPDEPVALDGVLGVVRQDNGDLTGEVCRCAPCSRTLEDLDEPLRLPRVIREVFARGVSDLVGVWREFGGRKVAQAPQRLVVAASGAAALAIGFDLDQTRDV